VVSELVVGNLAVFVCFVRFCSFWVSGFLCFDDLVVFVVLVRLGFPGILGKQKCLGLV